MIFQNINRLLDSPSIHLVLPLHKELNEFCYEIHKLFVKNTVFVYDDSKVFAKNVYWYFKEKNMRYNDIYNHKNEINYSKSYILMCHYNNKEYLFEVGNTIYQYLLFNYNKKDSCKLIVTISKAGPYNKHECTIIHNYDEYEYITNMNIKEAYLEYVKPNIISIYDRRGKDILNLFLKEYGLNYNFFYSKIRKDKLKIILND
jgi:hypothetical protein